MALELDRHDQALFDAARMEIRAAIENARYPAAVAKKLVAEAMKHRNRGRHKAIKSYPFQGVCEASGKPLDRVDAVLDELDPELGYNGRLRWVCPKANHSGRRSCGHC